MKIPASFGRSLVACLGAVSLATTSTPGPDARVLAPETRSSMSLLHLETCGRPESLTSPLVAEVRRAIGKTYRLLGADLPASQIVRDALQEQYGAHVTEEEEGLAYTWIWNPVTEQWERVCTSVTSFRVDFGAGGTVLVRTSDDMLLR